MNNKFKVASLVVALVMLFSTVAMAAVPAGVYIGGTVGKYYSTTQYVGNYTQAVSEMQNAGALKNTAYVDSNGKIARADEVLSTGSLNGALRDIAAGDLLPTYYDVDGNPINIEVPGELQVVSVSVKNATTVEVKFNKAVTQELTSDFFTVNGAAVVSVAPGTEADVYELTVQSLAGTKGTVTVNNVSATYDFTVPVPGKAAVENIELVNYRDLRVTFNTKVDEESAKNLDNYYLEMVEGTVADGTFGADAFTLDGTNQLSKVPGIEVAYNVIDNKSVVDILLPENARFTNVADDVYGVDDIDDEATLYVKLADGSSKALIKNTDVLVGVRNVKDFSGNRTIDNFVKSVKILDEQSPELENVYVQDTGTRTPKDPNEQISIKSDDTQKIVLEFNEPVFDAHDLLTSTQRDVKVYVDNKLAASTQKKNLANILDFNMSATGSYDGARCATLDVAKAVYAVGENFAVDQTFNITINGVTDLAGNIMVPSDINLNVKVVSPGSGEPTLPTKPIPLAVEQVADNIFRIEWNEAGAQGRFIIENADGEGGTIDVSTGVSTPVQPDPDEDIYYYYSYAVVNAVDKETGSDVTAKNNDILAYDGQDYINRVVKVNDPAVGTLKGDNKNFGTVKIQKDILAPVVVEPDDLEYDENNAVIELNVKDVVPYVEDFENEVIALKYKYANGDFDRNAVYDAVYDAVGDYLPITVSYKTADGALRSALVTNKNVPGAKGHSDSISYANGVLTLNLASYPTLLDKDGALVGGVQYTIEIPKGYFADPAKDIDLGTDDEYVTSAPGDILYVSDARLENYGYTSKAQTIVQSIAAKPEEPGDTTTDTVPQTSKQLISFNSSENLVTIEFKGTIDINTLKNPDNYVLNGKTLKQWGMTSDDIEYKQELDVNGNIVGQYAIFEVPVDSVASDGDVQLIVRGVTNNKGAMMAEVKTDIYLLDTKRPVATDAVVSGQRQIKLTFDEDLQYREDQSPIAAAKNFEVMAGSTSLTVLEAQVAGKVVTLNLGSNIPDTGTITVNIKADESGNILIIDMSENKNPLNDDNPISVRR